MSQGVLDAVHGWRVVAGRGWSEMGGDLWDDCGLTSHHGVLHPDEYVDETVLRAEVEAELGFTYDEVHHAYGLGRPTAERRELRDRIDARLFEVYKAGGNMKQLGRVLGFAVDREGTQGAIANAVRRALRQERDVRPTPGVR